MKENIHMKREQLQELGLEKEAIDKVLAEYHQAIKAEKDIFEAGVKDLQAQLDEANKAITEASESTKSVEQIKSELDDYKTKYEEANSTLETERKTNKLKESLTGAGGADLEYLMFKLGDVETDEIEAKVAELKEQLPGHFKSDDEPKQETPAGYEVISNKLDKGESAKTYSHSELENLSAEEINANWDVISQSLAQ